MFAVILLRIVLYLSVVPFTCASYCACDASCCACDTFSAFSSVFLIFFSVFFLLNKSYTPTPTPANISPPATTSATGSNAPATAISPAVSSKATADPLSTAVSTPPTTPSSAPPPTASVETSGISLGCRSGTDGKSGLGRAVLSPIISISSPCSFQFRKVFSSYPSGLTSATPSVFASAIFLTGGFPPPSPDLFSPISIPRSCCSCALRRLYRESSPSGSS